MPLFYETRANYSRDPLGTRFLFIYLWGFRELRHDLCLVRGFMKQLSRVKNRVKNNELSRLGQKNRYFTLVMEGVTR